MPRWGGSGDGLGADSCGLGGRRAVRDQESPPEGASDPGVMRTCVTSSPTGPKSFYLSLGSAGRKFKLKTTSNIRFHI